MKSKKSIYAISVLSALCISTILLLTSCTPNIETEGDKLSYTIGQDLGRSLKGLEQQGNPIDQDSLFKGIDESSEGKTKPDRQKLMKAMSDFRANKSEEAGRDVMYNIGLQVGLQVKQVKDNKFEYSRKVMQLVVKDGLAGKEDRVPQAERSAVMQKLQQMESEKNKKAGKEFLDENKKKEGVKETQSGLQYKVIKDGAGASPKKEQRVEVHYKGTLINGEEFDSSYKRNQPAQFGVTEVIKGWTEALQLMKPGAKWELFIPSDQAYGDQMRPNIPAGSTLIFEVELIKILPPEPVKKK